MPSDVPKLVTGLFEPISLARFITEYYGCRPLALREVAGPWRTRTSWSTLEELLVAPGADALVVRDNQRWEGTQTPDSSLARRLFDDGYTVLIRHAERSSDFCRALAAEFERLFLGCVDVHLYFTPARSSGFGCHYDAEEVFIVQTAGAKEYRLRKNTVHPWPLLEAIPADMEYEKECMPILSCQLQAGDWLYIPSGYWHQAQAREDSISISVGVAAPTGIDLLDFLRTKMKSDLRWRRRLPVLGAAQDFGGEVATRWAAVQGALIEDLQNELQADLLPAFREWLKHSRARREKQASPGPVL